MKQVDQVNKWTGKLYLHLLERSNHWNIHLLLTDLRTNTKIDKVYIARWFIWLVWLLVFTARGLRWCSGLYQACGCLWGVWWRQQYVSGSVRPLHPSPAPGGLQSHRTDTARCLQHHHLRTEAESKLPGWVSVLFQQQLHLRPTTICNIRAAIGVRVTNRSFQSG